MAKPMPAKDATLDGIAAPVGVERIDPRPRSGKQEWPENLFNRFS